MPNIIERQGNTEEQIAEYLAVAIRIFGEADIPDDLRQIAFSKLIDLAAAKTLVQEPTLAERQLFGHG